MGGGSSTDDKKNQIINQIGEQIIKNNQDKSKNASKKNSPKNSPRFNIKNQEEQDDNNMNDFVNHNLQIKNGNEFNNSQIAGRRSGNASKNTNKNSSKLNGSKLNNSKFQSNSNSKNSSRNERIGNEWLPQFNEVNIKLELIEITPYVQSLNNSMISKNTKNINQIQNQINHVEQKSSQYEALFRWSYQKQNKNWSFQLKQKDNNRVSLNFIVDSDNELQDGDDKKWLALNPLKMNNELGKFGKFLCEKIYLQQGDEDDNLMNGPIVKSKQDFQSNKLRLFADWGEEYIEKKANFQHKNINNKKNKNKNKNKNSQNYIDIRKFYNSISNSWQLTNFIEQSGNTQTFRGWLISIMQFESENDQQSINKLLQKQRNIISLKKEIFIEKTKIKLKIKSQIQNQGNGNKIQPKDKNNSNF